MFISVRYISSHWPGLAHLNSFAKVAIDLQSIKLVGSGSVSRCQVRKQAAMFVCLWLLFGFVGLFNIINSGIIFSNQGPALIGDLHWSRWCMTPLVGVIHRSNARQEICWDEKLAAFHHLFCPKHLLCCMYFSFVCSLINVDQKTCAPAELWVANSGSRPSSKNNSQGRSKTLSCWGAVRCLWFSLWRFVGLACYTSAAAAWRAKASNPIIRTGRNVDQTPPNSKGCTFASHSHEMSHEMSWMRKHIFVIVGHSAQKIEKAWSLK